MEPGAARNPRLGSRRPNDRVGRVGGGRSDGLEVKTCKLRARADAELPEDVAEVGGDRARAEEELRGDLAVAEPLRDEVCDLQLLLGQLGPGVGDATVAVSRSHDYLAANDGANPLVVLNEGFQSAFLALVVLAGIGMALALLLPGRPRKVPHERLQPRPATGAAT